MNGPVEDAAVQRRPRVDGPSAIDGAIPAEQRIPVSLTNVGKVLHIYEELESAG